MLRALYILAYVSASREVKKWYYDGLDCQMSNWVGEYDVVSGSCQDVTVGCTNNETENTSEQVSCCSSAGCGSDPHFRTWNTEHFSYHGACDLVLVKSHDFAAKAGLEIHIRTEHDPAHSFSFIKAIAMKIGDDIFEMEGKNKFRINDVVSNAAPTEFGGFPVRKVEEAKWCRDKCANAQIYRFFFGGHGHIEIANWRGFLHIELDWCVTGFHDATGLLGKEGVQGFIGRDGTKIHDVHQFGHSWQVRDSDPQLFLNVRDTHSVCTLPTNTQRRLDIATRRMAENACAHLTGDLRKMCSFDVESTGDRMMSYSPMFG